MWPEDGPVTVIWIVAGRFLCAPADLTVSELTPAELMVVDSTVEELTVKRTKDAKKRSRNEIKMCGFCGRIDET